MSIFYFFQRKIALLMLFQDCTLSPITIEKRTIDKFGKSIAIIPEAFMTMLTMNGLDRRISNPWLINACGEEMQRHLPHANVRIASVFLERESIFMLDQDTKQLKKVTDQELAVADVNTLVGSRAIIKIVAEGLNDGICPSVAVNLNPDGEEIALGENINICDNFTILGADRYLSTFSRHSDRNHKHMTTSEILEVIKKLFPKTEEFLAEDLSLIESLKAQQVSKSGWYQFTGELFGRIHYVNRMRLSRRVRELSSEIKNLPITAILLADITAEAEAPSHVEYDWQNGISNKWNAINFGTELIKPEHGISPRTILENNYQWTDMVVQRDFAAN